ncbi:hypothetical protein BH11MYX3_BH11MYX3_40890 [soil metagenome]
MAVTSSDGSSTGVSISSCACECRLNIQLHGYAVLMADPDTRLASLTARLLEMYGVRVVTVAESDDVRREMEGTSFGCVILSTLLVGDDAVDTCKRIRSAGLTPVIMVGSGGLEERARALRAGADAYMRKPYSTRDLLARITSIVRARWRPQMLFG